MRQKTTTICYLANADNYHTYKWASQFSLRGYGVHVLSLEECRSEAIRELKNVTVHYLQNPSARQGSELQKLGYLSTVGVARRLIEELDPDVVHAHYASSYGLVASLACRRPYYLSVWGSDVYDFPRKSPLHRAVVRRSLAKPAWLMSTSRAKAEECAKYTGRDFEITPFGVDMGLFSPRKREPHEGLVVGTVKALERKYGIDTLLRGCALLHDRRPDLGVRVRIAGKGTMEAELKALATRLGMDGYLDWLGFIPQEEAAREWAGLDIAIVESDLSYRTSLALWRPATAGTRPSSRPGATRRPSPMPWRRLPTTRLAAPAWGPRAEPTWSAPTRWAPASTAWRRFTVGTWRKRDEGEGREGPVLHACETAAALAPLPAGQEAAGRGGSIDGL